MLSGNGFAVEEAVNGEEALIKARENQPDMIISDILMPVMDGFKLCHEVRADEQLKNTAFVFYTASYLDKRDKELALNLGVDRYLTKPQEPEKLLQVFREVLDAKKKSKGSTPPAATILENDYLKDHNESLVRMLEKKLEQLDHSKRVLEEEILVRRETEKKLKASVQEKDVLLKEVYHRTKNNMQVIVGLLDLQVRKAGHLSVDAVFREMSDRIYSMSMVHDLLYRSKSLYEIRLDHYLDDLSRRLLTVYEKPETEIELLLASDPISVNIQFAVPLGLVITEIISNALKYAFPNRTSGTIKIEARLQKDQGLLLKIGDDGVGVKKDDLATSESKTLGMYLIRTIIEEQLYGGYSLSHKKGLTYSISLPDLLLEG